MHPADIIFFWARSNPEHPALIQSDLVLTYRELASAIEAVSDRIAHYGFVKDEPVAVSIHQPIQQLVVCLALMRHGISAVPVAAAALPHLRANGIDNIIFTGQGLMLSGGRNIRFDDAWLRSEPKSAAAKFSATESLAQAAAAIFLTPAETGGLERTIVPSATLMARVKILPLVGEANYDRVLIVPSLNTPSGLSRAAVNLYAGRTACFAASDAARLLAVNAFGIDALVCTPRQAADLVDFALKNPTYPVDALREVWIEDGYVSRDLGKQVQTQLCRNLIVGYGSAATGRFACASFDSIADVPGAVGFVVPHADVEIVDSDNAPLAAGEVGRVRCHSEFYAKVVAANKLEQTDKVDEAWWYSGDFGHLTSDDLLCITCRDGSA